MYKVEYLYEGHWKVAIEIGGRAVAESEFHRLASRYLVRMSGPDIVGYYF